MCLRTISGISDISFLSDAPFSNDEATMPIIGETKERLLKTLAKQPLHGYALSRELGVSLSSIYEHLADLEREDLVKAEQSGRRKVWKLTTRGRALLELLSQDR